MQIRYLGFEQAKNGREYHFDRVAKGDDARQEFVVMVDLSLFRLHGVGIQEGPTLCAQKLVADLTTAKDGAHELTTDDLRAYASEREAEQMRRIEARKGGPRRPKVVPGNPPSPWREPRP